ncbi:unnamed protein product, partial [Rotaria sordida]
MGIKEAKNTDSPFELFKSYFIQNSVWLQMEGVQLMHDSLFPRKEVADLYSILQDIGEKWVPLSYRIFGLPCGIDGGPLGDQGIDLTMMTQDVDLITRFLEDLKNNYQATPGMARRHLKDKELQISNPHFPASALFNNIKEVHELLASRYFVSLNDDVVFHDYQCCCPLISREGKPNLNVTYFIYVAGHGLLSQLATDITGGLTSLEKSHPQYKGYLVARPDYGRLNEDELLEAGHIVAFTKFLSIQDF